MRRLSLQTLSFTCAALLVAAACPTSQAADKPASGDMPSYGEWHSSRFGGGGYVLQTVVSPSDPTRVYAHVDVGGVYRSDDSGRSWRMLHGNLPAHRSSYSVRSVWVDPQDPDCLLVAAGGRWDGKLGVLRSTDGGESWEKTYDAWFWGNGSRRASGSILRGDPNDADRVYLAAIDDGFALSDDAGKTWTDTGQLKGLNPTDIWVDPSKPEHIWVACYERKVKFDGKERHFKRGLYFSADRGQTFEQVSDKDFSELMQLPWGDRPLVGLADQCHVLASTDNGRTWQPLEDGLPIDEAAAKKSRSTSGSAFNSVAVGPDFVLVGSRRGAIYRLDKNSTTWRHIKPDEVREGDWWGRMKPGKWQHYGKAMSSITISPADPDHWYTTDWYGVYQSTDAGKTWDLSIDGIEVTVIHTITPDPTKPSLVHLGMADNGYVRSGNRGVSFNKPGGGPSNVKHIAPSYAADGLLFKVGPKGHEWLANQLYRSTNHGDNWSRCKMRGLPDMEKHRCNSVAPDPTNPDRVWLAVSGKIAPGEGGVYVSEDRGESFKWDSQGMAGSSFFATSIWQPGPELAISENGSMVATSAGGRAVYTRPAGATEWQKVSLDLPSWGKPSSVAASVHAPGIMVVAIRGTGIFRSSDDGVTFEKIWGGDASYVALDPKLPNRIAASTDKGIILSTDYGKTFEYLDQHLPDRVTRLPLAFVGNRLVVGTAGSGIFYIDLPKNQQALSDAPWIDQLTKQVCFLKTDQMQLGVLRNGGNVVDFRLIGQPNLMDSDSSTWVKESKSQPSAAIHERVEYGGHTVWLCPQSHWWQYQTIDPKRKASHASWPPDPYLTQMPYEVVEQSKDRLVLQSQPSPITGVQLTKTFEIKSPTSLKLTMRAENVSEQTLDWGLWSNARVKPAGHVFIPVPADPDYVVQHVNPWRNPDPKYRFEVTEANGWLSLTNHAPEPYDAVRDTKLRVNPTERLLVYRLGDQAMVKRSPDVNGSTLPEEHRSIESYRSESAASPTREVFEIQFLYPQVMMRPGEAIEATEEWILMPLNELDSSTGRDGAAWLETIRQRFGDGT